MKRWYFLAALLLLCVYGLPFRQYDTAKLLPIRTLQAAKTENGVKLVSEAGSGEGADWMAAVKDLRKKASGSVFFDTAEQIVFCSPELAEQAIDSDMLRPAAQVYFSETLRDPEGLNAYLSAHESNMTVAKLRAAMHKE